MQIAVIEFARNVAGLKDANSSEFNEFATDAVIFLMLEWFDERSGSVEKRDESSDKGATMRLGAYPCRLINGTLAHRAYGLEDISERHRHRYEVDIAYREKLEQAGLCFSGMSPDGRLPEIVEVKDHPWFIGVQFHPELKSKPFAPHPLFADFDNDGDLDLYAANYLEFSYETHVARTIDGLPRYPVPRDFTPVPDSLFRSNGDGTFADISLASGVAEHAGTGMGMVCLDYDDDGDMDLDCPRQKAVEHVAAGENDAGGIQ